MDWAVSGMLDSVFNSSIINFFKTGNFDFHLPLQAKLSLKIQKQYHPWILLD